MYCSKLFEALDKLLAEKKSLDEIGIALCDGVDDQRGKALRLIKAHKDEQFVIDNADWLKFDITHIRNPEGKNRPKKSGQKKKSRKELMEDNSRPPTPDEYTKWDKDLEEIENKLQNISNEISRTNRKSYNDTLQNNKKRIRTIRDDFFIFQKNPVDEQSLRVKDFKRIAQLITINGLINEFIINKDGSILASSPDKTIQVNLKYKGKSLPEDIAIDDCDKLKKLFSKFLEETVIEMTEKEFSLHKIGKHGDFPRVGVDAIKKVEEFPEIEYPITIHGVPLGKLRKAAKKIYNFKEQYVFAIEDGFLKVRVGDAETGTFTESIVEVSYDKPLHSTFGKNLPRLIKILEENPTISMGDDLSLKIDVTTDTYFVSYVIRSEVP